MTRRTFLALALTPFLLRRFCVGKQRPDEYRCLAHSPVGSERHFSAKCSCGATTCINGDIDFVKEVLAAWRSDHDRHRGWSGTFIGDWSTWARSWPWSFPLPDLF